MATASIGLCKAIRVNFCHSAKTLFPRWPTATWSIAAAGTFNGSSKNQRHYSYGAKPELKPSEIRQIIRMHQKQKLSAKEIAAKLQPKSTAGKTAAPLPEKSKRGTKPGEKRPARPPWSTDELARLSILHDRGASIEDIQAEIPHRTSWALRTKALHQFGYTLHNRRKLASMATRRQLLALRDEGLSWAQIERDHFPGRSLNALRISYFGAREMEERGNLRGEEHLEQMKAFRHGVLQLREEGRAWAEIFEAFPERGRNALRVLVSKAKREKKAGLGV